MEKRLQPLLKLGSKAGRWRQIFKALQLKVGPPWKPGRCDNRAGTPGFGGSKRGPAVNCLGRSRGGFSTKVHALSGRPGPPDPRRIDGWPDSRSDGRSLAARTRRRPSVHRRHRIRRGTDSGSGGRSRDEGCDPLASHEGDRASTRQEALPDPLPHRVSVSPPQALSSARDPLRKDPVATTLRSSIWGLRSDLDQHALMPRNCIPGTDETSGMLDHEKLDVYQRAIEFVACALRIAERLPRGQAPLADQLRRAAVSIPLNIAEGGGRNRESADRARFRAIARGSAMESGALLDVIRLLSVVPQEDWGPRQVSLGPRRRNAQQDVLRPPPRGRGRGRIRGRGRGRGRAPRQIGTPPS